MSMEVNRKRPVAPNDTLTHRPFADLALPPIEKDDVPAADADRKAREFVYVEPHFVAKLVALCNDNGAEAARKLGVNKTTVNTALREGRIILHYELAAKAMVELEELQKLASDPADVVFMCRLYAPLWQKIKPWLEQAGAKFTVLK